MNGLSLFAGIGGMDLGLERAGITTVGQVEIDPWCRQVLAKHWPDVPRHDDVRTAADWWLSEERPHVDLIYGGFPCQDISGAGRKIGIRGARSGLWGEFAGVIRLLRPRWVLLENVADILVRGLDVVLADLAEIGYDAEWDCVPAAAVGASHLRDRWFAVAYPNGQQLRQQSISVPGRRGPAVAGADGAAEHVAHPAVPRRGLVLPDCAVTDDGQAAVRTRQTKPGRRSGAGRVFRRPVICRWPTEPSMGRVVDGLSAGVVRPQLRGLGNAVVPQVAEHLGRLLVAADQEARRAVS